MNNVRFVLDEDNDIVDNLNCKVYTFNSEKDWERLCMVLNSLEIKRCKSEDDYNNIVEVLSEEYEEYNNYIDEYSLIKTDILMDLLGKLNIDID